MTASSERERERKRSERGNDSVTVFRCCIIILQGSLLPSLPLLSSRPMQHSMQIVRVKQGEGWEDGWRRDNASPAHSIIDSVNTVVMSGWIYSKYKLRPAKRIHAALAPGCRYTGVRRAWCRFAYGREDRLIPANIWDFTVSYTFIIRNQERRQNERISSSASPCSPCEMF